MKIFVTILSLVNLLCFAAFGMAADKVVVIPMQSNNSSSAASIASAGVLESCEIALTAGNGGSGCSFTTVPAGKVLVVEFISGYMTMPSGQIPLVQTFIGNGAGSVTNHSLNSIFQRTVSTSDQYIVSQDFKIYVPEGQALGVSLSRSVTTGTTLANYWISGYLVDKL